LVRAEFDGFGLASSLKIVVYNFGVIDQSEIKLIIIFGQYLHSLLIMVIENTTAEELLAHTVPDGHHRSKLPMAF